MDLQPGSWILRQLCGHFGPFLDGTYLCLFLAVHFDTIHLAVPKNKDIDFHSFAGQHIEQIPKYFENQFGFYFGRADVPYTKVLDVSW